MRRRPKSPIRNPLRGSTPERDFDREFDRSSDRPAADNKPKGSMLSAVNLAIIAAVFILGMGIGITFSSTTTFSPQNVASREFIDRSAPSAEICAQYGASAVTMDMRAFVTLNPFSVYLSQPSMQPGCVLRNTNFAVLERNKRVNPEQVSQCRRRMNTFGFTGNIEDGAANVRVDCVYQNDDAQNLFLDRSGINAPAPESSRF